MKRATMYLQTQTYGHNFVEYSIWIVTVMLVAFGFRFARDLIVFVLDKLYQFFIQNASL